MEINLQLSSFSEPLQYHIPVLGRDRQYLMWLSAVIVCPRWGLKRCVLWVLVAFLSAWKRFGFSPLSSTMGFLPTKPQLTGFSDIPKYQESMVKLTDVTFYPILMVPVTTDCNSWAVSAWSYTLHRCLRIGWLDNCTDEVGHRWSS